MSAQLVFSFPHNVSHETVLSVVNAHFLPNKLPEADNPAAGMIATAAQAFGIPSDAQRAFAAPNSADAAQSATALMGNTSLPGSVAAAFAQAPASAAAAQPDNATPSSPAGSGAAVQYDKDGRPWDARIDSDPPSLTAKNEWRKKRNTPDELIAQVSAELRAAGKYATPSPAFTATKYEGLRNLQAHELAMQKVGPMPFSDEVFVGILRGVGQTTLDPAAGTWYIAYNQAYNEARSTLGLTAGVAGAPALPAAGATPSLPPMMPAAVPQLSEHAKFVLWVAGEVQAGRLTEVKVAELLKQCNVLDDSGNGSVQALAKFPDFIPQVKDFLIKNYGAQA